jgi:ATP-dependent DNA helicase RecQ
VPALENTLRTSFGHASFRQGQREIVESVLSGRPTMAVLPTGSGKSLCYQLPALLLDGLTLVVSPLIALMKDQVDALTARGIPAACVSSGQSPEAFRLAMDRFRSGALKLLYVAPERFANARFCETLSAAKVSLFAIDEAHCVSEWGHDFRPDYRRLAEAISLSRAPRVLALTATATREVREDVARSLAMERPEVFVRGFNRDNLHFEVHAAGGEADKYSRVDRLLEKHRGEGSAIVYAATRGHAENAAMHLVENGHRAAPYHAGLDPEVRRKTQERFQAGSLDVIVATNAFGMGIDKSDVRLVAHVGLPRSLDAYYQEVGRAGRDGKASRVVLLFNYGDVKLAEWLIDNASGDSERAIARTPAQEAALRARELARLSAMVRYASTTRCRRQQILDYFGDPEPIACTGCDVCGTEGARALSAEEHLAVRKLLSVVARLRGRFGRAKIADVALGERTPEVLRAQLADIPSFGVLRDFRRDRLLKLLSALEGARCVETSRGEYPTIALTPTGVEVMHDRLRIDLKLGDEGGVKHRRAKRRAAAAPKSRPDERAHSPAPSAASETPDPALLDRLKTLRRKLSGGMPAYIVFPDSVLKDFARLKPESLAALSRISGVGPVKLERYGTAFLNEIGRHEKGE